MDAAIAAAAGGEGSPSMSTKEICQAVPCPYHWLNSAIRAGKIAVWLASYQERMPVPCWLLLKTKFRRTHEYLALMNTISMLWNQLDHTIFSSEPSPLTAWLASFMKVQTGDEN